jgi:hypothetical protein
MSDSTITDLEHELRHLHGVYSDGGARRITPEGLRQSVEANKFSKPYWFTHSTHKLPAGSWAHCSCCGKLQSEVLHWNLLALCSDCVQTAFPEGPRPPPDYPALMRQALGALETCMGVPHWPALTPTIAALRAALGETHPPVQGKEAGNV